MPHYSYSAEQALAVLIKKIREQDERLAAHIQAAIDAGKDVKETAPAIDQRKKPRVYRKTVPFSHEEALQVALDALRAYFVEQPLFINSVADNLAKAAVGVPTERRPARQMSAEKPEPVSLEQVGEEKRVEIELQTETQISRSGEETMPLKRLAKEQIEVQRENIARLRKLTDFSEE
jgi:hypothetical protein